MTGCMLAGGDACIIPVTSRSSSGYMLQIDEFCAADEAIKVEDLLNERKTRMAKGAPLSSNQTLGSFFCLLFGCFEGIAALELSNRNIRSS